MDRRLFLKRSAIIATGAIAADQLELLERLTHVRRLFPSASLVPEPTKLWIRVFTAPDAYADYPIVRQNGTLFILGASIRPQRRGAYYQHMAMVSSNGRQYQVGMVDERTVKVSPLADQPRMLLDAPRRELYRGWSK